MNLRMALEALVTADKVIKLQDVLLKMRDTEIIALKQQIKMYEAFRSSISPGEEVSLSAGQNVEGLSNEAPSESSLSVSGRA